MSTPSQLEEKIYSLVPELERIRESILVDYRECIYVCSICQQQCNSDWCDCSYKKNHYYPIYPHHWLPLLESYAMDGYGNILEAQPYMYKWNRNFTQLNIKYDFKKSFKDQSPEFHEWLDEQL